LVVAILLLAFFTIKNVKDNRAKNLEIAFFQQMKIQQTELIQKLQLMGDSLQQLQDVNNENISNSLKAKKLEAEIKKLEALQEKSKNSSKNSKIDNKEVLILKKQIKELTRKENANSQSSQDKKEIISLKKQLAEVSKQSKSKSLEGDYAIQIQLLKKQLKECKKGGSGSFGKTAGGGLSKEEAYKKRIADLEGELAQYTQALSSRAKENSDNIKMVAQNIQGTGLYVDKKSNTEKSTMFVAKMRTFKVSFTLTSVEPMEGDITLVVRLCNIATNEVLKIPGIPYVEILKGEDEKFLGTYAQIVNAKGQKKIYVQQIFDAYSEFQKLNKNAMYMIEIYTRKGHLLGTQKIKIMAGETVTTF
ncbi:MAG: hypothetical protein ACRC0A_02390, partial [Chitinophagaceae bacterium]